MYNEYIYLNDVVMTMVDGTNNMRSLATRTVVNDIYLQEIGLSTEQ